MLTQAGRPSHKDTGLLFVALRQEGGGFLMGEKTLAECACPVRWKGRGTRDGTIDARQVAATERVRGDSRYEVQKDEPYAGVVDSGRSSRSQIRRESEREGEGSLVEGGRGGERRRKVEMVGSRMLSLAQVKWGRGKEESEGRERTRSEKRRGKRG
jgi:hypothetical protein